MVFASAKINCSWRVDPSPLSGIAGRGSGGRDVLGTDGEELCNWNITTSSNNALSSHWSDLLGASRLKPTQWCVVTMIAPSIARL